MEGTRATTNTTLKGLYRKLKAVGFSAPFLRQNVLPDWWEDSLAAIPANRLMIESIISRQLGFDLESLRNPDAPLQLQPKASARFKLRAGLDASNVEVMHSLAARLAEISIMCIVQTLRTERSPAQEIRVRLLENTSCINHETLLKYCWDIGVPVVHLCQRPTGAKHLDGAAICVDGKPAIVIGCQRKQPAWHLFILAHELGHIMLNHLPESNDAVWDDKVDIQLRDKCEREANEFAVALLAGNPNIKFAPTASWLTAEELAESARSLGEQMRIDPGYVALNYAWNQKLMAVGIGAVNHLYPNANVFDSYRKYYDSLDFECVPDDSAHFFDSLTS